MKRERKWGEEKSANNQKNIPFELKTKKNMISFFLNVEHQNKDVDIYINDEYLLTARSGKTGIIKIKKNNEIGSRLVNAINNGEKIRIMC